MREGTKFVRRNKHVAYIICHIKHGANIQCVYAIDELKCKNEERKSEERANKMMEGMVIKPLREHWKTEWIAGGNGKP